jgi:uncharacterized membrane protein YeaQ/YmgE (transglycosylase-associated protein family)
MEIIIILLVAALIGWLADLVVPGRMPFGFIGAIIAGLVGSYIGGVLIGQWGPTLGGFYVIPSLIGAAVVALIVSFIMKALARRPT